MKTREAGISYVTALGMAMAVVVSWSHTQSFWWTAFHGLCNWGYIIARALFREWP